MLPSAIRDFRMGVEQRFPRADVIQGFLDRDFRSWSCEIAIGGARRVVEWNDVDGFRMEERCVKNVDAALADLSAAIHRDLPRAA